MKSIYRTLTRAAAAGVAVLTLMVVPAVSGAQEDVDAGQLVRDVRKTIDGIKTFTCNFRWEHTWASADRTQRMAGRLWMKKPNLLRVESPERTLVIDGDTVWDYITRNKQVQLHDFQSSGERYPTPDQIFDRYAGTRTTVVVGQEDVDGRICDVVRLIPPTREDRDIIVWIDREHTFPVKVLETEPNGDTTKHVLTGIELNPEIDDSLFTFTAPDGVDIVDLRE